MREDNPRSNSSALKMGGTIFYFLTILLIIIIGIVAKFAGPKFPVLQFVSSDYPNELVSVFSTLVSIVVWGVATFLKSTRNVRYYNSIYSKTYLLSHRMTTIFSIILIASPIIAFTAYALNWFVVLTSTLYIDYGTIIFFIVPYFIYYSKPNMHDCVKQYDESLTDLERIDTLLKELEENPQVCQYVIASEFNRQKDLYSRGEEKAVVIKRIPDKFNSAPKKTSIVEFRTKKVRDFIYALVNCIGSLKRSEREKYLLGFLYILSRNIEGQYCKEAFEEFLERYDLDWKVERIIYTILVIHSRNSYELFFDYLKNKEDSPPRSSKPNAHLFAALLERLIGYTTDGSHYTTYKEYINDKLDSINESDYLVSCIAIKEYFVKLSALYSRSHEYSTKKGVSSEESKYHLDTLNEHLERKLSQIVKNGEKNEQDK